MTDQHQNNNHHKELLNRLEAMEEENKRRFDIIADKLDPMHELFTNVRSFNGVAVWIVKAFILFGAGIGVIYGLIKWLKN